MEDALQRKRFCEEIDRDFSVIAPAGVGKTFSIVERIYNIACRYPERLKSLCVITYTKKAAEELKNRVSECLKQHPQQSILGYLSQSFFGTIHSLCWQHIRLFRQDAPTLLPDDHIIREKFIANYCPNETIFKEITQFVDLSKLLDLTEAFPPYEDANGNNVLKPFHLDLQPIYDYVPSFKNQTSVSQMQHNLKLWELNYQIGKAVGIPDCLKGGKDFSHIFYKTLEPFFVHLGEIAVMCIKKLSQAYFEYRIQHGHLKHADLIFFAERCLNTEEAQAYFSKHPMTIVLDEAQDTDEHQFRYIRKLYSINPKNRFSMVGDPQQSIYSRTDVQTYLDLHHQLVAEGNCEALVFSNTFRCPRKIVSVLNKKFPQILSKAKDPQQVDYVPLVSVSKLEGSYKEIFLPPLPENDITPIQHEARYISKFLENYLRHNPRPLSDICLLVPRKNWLEELKCALSLFGWNLQIYSHTTTYRDNLLFCAILAFVHLVNFPEDGFELAGILHGVFGISETDITLFDQPIQIAYPCDPNSSPITSLLKELFRLRKTVIALPPWTGIGYILQYFKHLCSNCDPDYCCEELILETAFQVQSTECTWTALEFRLQHYLDTAIENKNAPCDNTLQGFSCHKAKGLEWPTVILPFFYRPIRYSTKRYPFSLNGKIVWNKYGFENTTELLDFQKRELQRLLYVTCTRAKQHLVILNDNVLWKQENTHPSLGQLYTTE